MPLRHRKIGGNLRLVGRGDFRMDNCSIHKSDEIEVLVASVGARIIYLPTDSPDFSP
jgi:transposase